MLLTTMIEHEVLSSDGHVLRVAEHGDPDGRPVLMHHGSPGCRLAYAGHVELAYRQGIRLITYDRPGYGGSARRPGRVVGDCAADVRSIADALGIGRLGVWGISGGGPHALACAALLPELVPAVAVLASPAPWDADDLDYFAGMGELNIEDTRLALTDKAAARARMETEREETLSASPQDFAVMMRTLLGPADRSALTGDLAEFVIAQTRAALAPGIDGWWDDAEAELSPWGFALAQIRTPVMLWHGRQDRFVPFEHGEWLAAHIPGVEAHLSDDDGHLTLTENHLEQTHDWLLERL